MAEKPPPPPPANRRQNLLTLPNDIIINILTRILVNSLLNCKLVCKSWLSLITTATFATHHTHHHHCNHHHLNRTLIVSDKSSNLYAVNLDSPQYLARKLRVNFTNFLKNKKILFIGSCNGILCIYECSNKDHEVREKIILFNPVIDLYTPISDPKISCCSFYGYGYDPIELKHKLVRVLQYSEGLLVTHPTQVRSGIHWVIEIYSFETGKWRIVGDAELFPKCCFLNAFESGAEIIGTNLLHWILRPWDDSDYEVSPKICCFDVCKEMWSEVPIPSFADSGPLDMYEHQGRVITGNHYKLVLLKLGVLGGCLSLIANNRLMTGVFNVWVMKEYGVVESWVKLLDVSDDISELYFHFPVTWSKDGREILMMIVDKMGMQHFWYDVSTKYRWVSAGFDGIPNISSLILFHEGLGMIAGGV